MQTNRGFIQLLGPILIIIAIGVGGYIYYQQNYNKPAPAPITEGEVGSGSSNEGSFGTNSQPKPVAPAPTQPVACTADAKICPDGSAVGRTGPKCEFSACPAAPITKTEKSVVNVNLTQEEKFIKLKEFLFPNGTTREWRIDNVVNTLYPANTLPKKAAYLLVDLKKDMIANPKVKRDLNRVYSISKCADYDMKAVTINGIDSGTSKTELINLVVINQDINAYSSYHEASSNISAGSPDQYNSEAEACAVVFSER